MRVEKDRFNIIMSKDLHDRVRDYSDEHGVSISATIAIAVGAFLDNMDMSKRIMNDPAFVAQIFAHQSKLMGKN